jgi:parallel beta-helix repeat protein
MKRLILFVLLICSISALEATNYYVSSTGNDANSGLTTALPWKTIAKVNTVNFASGDKILLKRGDTWYGTIIPKYSATIIPITYGAYGAGSQPIITGLTTITSGWTNEGGGIYSKVITAESQTNMVLIDGKQYAMGRTPNKGSWLTYESFSTNVSITDNQLTGTPNWTGAETCIYKNGWEIDRCLVTNHTTTTITYTDLAASNNTPILAHSEGKYFFQNSLQTLDAFGEWYHDFSGTGKFYMYFGAVNPNTKTIKIATLDNLLLNATGRDNLTIRDISFYGCIKDAVKLNWQNDDANILACTISYTGLSAMLLNGVGQKVDSCMISNVNSIGIYTTGINATLTNNNISKIGLPEAQGSIGIYRGAILLYGDNPTIQSNAIDSTAYSGIAFNQVVLNTLVKGNYIKNTCVLRWDLASVYTSTTTQRQSFIIENNTIIGSGGSGIYFDQGSGNMIARYNTIANCFIQGIKNNGSKDNTVINNTIYNCTTGIGFANWTTDTLMQRNTVTGNIVVAKIATQVAFSYTTRCTGSATEIASHDLNNNIYARPIDDNTTISTNVLTEGELTKTLAQWQGYSGKDVDTKKSPFAVSAESDLRFEYNSSSSPVTIPLGQNYRDIATNSDHTSVTLYARTAIILLKHAAYASTSSRKDLMYNGKRLHYNGKTLRY